MVRPSSPTLSIRNKDFHPDDFLEHNEFARLIHVSPRTLARYRERGLVPFIQLSQKKFIYAKVDSVQFIRSRYNTEIFKTESNGQGLLFA